MSVGTLEQSACGQWCIAVVGEFRYITLTHGFEFQVEIIPGEWVRTVMEYTTNGYRAKGVELRVGMRAMVAL